MSLTGQKAIWEFRRQHLSILHKCCRWLLLTDCMVFFLLCGYRPDSRRFLASFSGRGLNYIARDRESQYPSKISPYLSSTFRSKYLIRLRHISTFFVPGWLCIVSVNSTWSACGNDLSDLTTTITRKANSLVPLSKLFVFIVEENASSRIYDELKRSQRKQ